MYRRRPPRLCSWATAIFHLHLTYFLFPQLPSYTMFIVHQQQYVDDTQLYLAVSPTSYTHVISTLQSFNTWFCANGMALNPSKSAVICLALHIDSLSLSNLKYVNVAGTVIPLSEKVKILGTTLDSNLTMEHHTEALSSSCSYHSFIQI